MCNIGIGGQTPKEKLNLNPLKGYKFFDKIMVRSVMWVCERRDITVSFSLRNNRVKHGEPKHVLHIGNGNVGL